MDVIVHIDVPYYFPENKELRHVDSEGSLCLLFNRFAPYLINVLQVKTKIKCQALEKNKTSEASEKPVQMYSQKTNRD